MPSKCSKYAERYNQLNNAFDDDKNSKEDECQPFHMDWKRSMSLLTDILDGEKFNSGSYRTSPALEELNVCRFKHIKLGESSIYRHSSYK